MCSTQVCVQNMQASTKLEIARRQCVCGGGVRGEGACVGGRESGHQEKGLMKSTSDEATKQQQAYATCLNIHAELPGL